MYINNQLPPDRFNDYNNNNSNYYNAFTPTHTPNYFPDPYNQQQNQEEQLRLQQKEIFDYKKLLRILAIAVFLTIVGKEAMSFLVGAVLGSLNLVFEFRSMQLLGFNYFSATVSPLGAQVLTADSRYFILWAVNDIIVYTPPLIIFAVAFKEYMNFQRGVRDFPSWGAIAFFTAGYGVAWAASNLTHRIAAWFDSLFGTGELRSIFADVQPVSSNQWLLMYFFVGFLGPVIEEIIYRHLLLIPLRRFGDWQAVVITSLLFGAFHGNLTQFLYTAIAGFILGIAAVRANSVMPAIWIHVFNNSFDIGKSHLWELSVRGQIPMSPSTVNSLYTIVVYGGLLLAIFLLIAKHFSVTNHNPHISGRERARMAVMNPWILAMTVMLVIVVIRGS
jgi:membrane protease YdiL (CAAX protease family)